MLGYQDEAIDSNGCFRNGSFTSKCTVPQDTAEVTLDTVLLFNKVDPGPKKHKMLIEHVITLKTCCSKGKKKSYDDEVR